MSIGLLRVLRHAAERLAAPVVAARAGASRRAPGRRDEHGNACRVSTASAAGFTLVEVLVAFAVAILLIGVLHELFAASLRAGVSAGRLDDAVLIAQSALDTATAIPGAVDETERLGPYERRVRITPRSDLPASLPPVGVIVYQVNVTVAWRDGLRSRTVALSTLRPGPAPQR